LAGVALRSTTELPPRPEAFELLEAEKIVLKSPNGSPRILIGTTKDGSASVLLLDSEGKARLTLSVSPEGNPVVQVKPESVANPFTKEATKDEPSEPKRDDS
jgi:hypothetical protein